MLALQLAEWFDLHARTMRKVFGLQLNCQKENVLVTHCAYALSQPHPKKKVGDATFIFRLCRDIFSMS